MYLSKSDFKVTRTCAAKLYYRKLGYPSVRDDDEYLRFLADGGYIVETIAKICFPEGMEIGWEEEPEKSAAETLRRLQEYESVTLFEATLLAGQKPARADILRKQRDTLELIEVKAKLVDRSDGTNPFRGTRGNISSEWQPYLKDVTFQYSEPVKIPRRARAHVPAEEFADRDEAVLHIQVALPGAARAAYRRAERTAEPALRARSLCAPPDFPGDGRRRQRQRDQARDVGVNPQGCEVYSFKQPSAGELEHDFLWRTTRCLPERGRIGIFNRSYYEEVLVVRVHPEILRGERLPDELVNEKTIWEERYRSIADLENHLYRNGTRLLKFFLHVSKEEQRKRFLARLDDPEKNWKFGVGDVAERHHWDDYMKAYEACLRATSTEQAPWYVVPADDKKNARLIISQAIVETLKSLKMSYPQPDEAQQRELESIAKLLMHEKS